MLLPDKDQRRAGTVQRQAVFCPGAIGLNCCRILRLLSLSQLRGGSAGALVARAGTTRLTAAVLTGAGTPATTVALGGAVAVFADAGPASLAAAVLAVAGTVAAGAILCTAGARAFPAATLATAVAVFVLAAASIGTAAALAGAGAVRAAAAATFTGRCLARAAQGCPGQQSSQCHRSRGSKEQTTIHTESSYFYFEVVSGDRITNATYRVN